MPGTIPGSPGRYVQDQLGRESADPLVSPLVRELALSWKLAGVHEDWLLPSTGMRLRSISPSGVFQCRARSGADRCTWALAIVR